MKYWRLGGAIFGVTSAIIAATARVPANAQSKVDWLSDYDAACATSRQEHKPLFVVFR